MAVNDDEDTLIQAVVDAGLLVLCYVPVTRKVIDAGKNLKAILKWGVGVDAIDFKAANKRGLPSGEVPYHLNPRVA